MIPFFLGFELFDEERQVLEANLAAFARSKDVRSVHGRISREVFEQLFMVDMSKQEDFIAHEAKVTLRKVHQSMKLKNMALISELETNYMTEQEKIRQEINRRSVKHFFFKACNLQSQELDNLVKWFDQD